MMTLLVVVLMILSALVIALPGMQGREYGMNPAATSSSNIQPNPTMNVNITWSTYHKGWSPLEYNNGTANLSLNTQLSTLYVNPISVNPSDIKANGSLQNDKLGSSNDIWENTSLYTDDSTTNDSSYARITSSNGYLEICGNTSQEKYTQAEYSITINVANFPSNNLAYDYATLMYGLSGAPMTGVGARIGFVNSSYDGARFGSEIHPGQVAYISENLAQFQQQMNYNPSFNISGQGKTTDLQIDPLICMPLSSPTEAYTLTIYGMAFTDYAMTLGTNSSGTVNSSAGNAELTNFSPSFPWTEITNNGYSVAVSQPLQNLTTQQSAINSGSYIEQVEYQGQFNLPTAPDLSYGSANITEHFNVSTSQTQVLDINDVSYLSTISGKNNTVQLISSVNPNSQTQFLQIVDYTQSQWTSISSPPGIFTLAGIEYYWEEFIIAILAIVGVGAGAASRHASNLRKVK